MTALIRSVEAVFAAIAEAVLVNALSVVTPMLIRSARQRLYNIEIYATFLRSQVTAF